MHLVIFETSAWVDFAPITLTRPVFCLASGMVTLLQRQLRVLKPDRLTLWVRPELAEFCRQRVLPQLHIPADVNRPLDDSPAILLNAAICRPAALPAFPPATALEPCIHFAPNGHVAFAAVQSPGLCPADIFDNSSRWQEVLQLRPIDTPQQLATQIADLIHENDKLITEDFADLSATYQSLPAGLFHAIGSANIRVGPDVQISPGVVLDASSGPIVLDSGVHVGANSVIEGPCYIGPKTTVRPLTLVRGGMTIGPACKVGGELAQSVIQGNSNKGHDGYLGHSFLGEWVNLGAGTITSNLKNTYGQISLKIGARDINTGKIFMGALIGDFTKTAIGTRLMSGSYLGVNTMIACSDYSPRFIGSFRFITDARQEPYELNKAVEVAKRVFARRNRPFTGVDTQLMDYARTAAETAEG